MDQRYYDPQIGRFLSIDPVSTNPNNGGNFDRYWYASNNPYRFTDPDGRAITEVSSGSGVENFVAGDSNRKPPPEPIVDAPVGRPIKTITSKPGQSREDFIARDVDSAVNGQYRKKAQEYCGCIDQVQTPGGIGYQSILRTNDAASFCNPGCATTPNDYHNHTIPGVQTPLKPADHIYNPKVSPTAVNWETSPGISKGTGDAALAPGTLIQIGRGAFTYDSTGALKKIEKQEKKK